MFDIGWTEVLVLAAISLFIIGPKDIPKFLGYIGRIIGKIRSITGEFKETVDDAIKDSEFEEIKKEISLADHDISKSFSDIINPVEDNKNKDNASNSLEANNKKNTEESDKSTVREEKKLSSRNTETKRDNVAGPIDKLPSGLKHIRTDKKN